MSSVGEILGQIQSPSPVSVDRHRLDVAFRIRFGCYEFFQGDFSADSWRKVPSLPRLGFLMIHSVRDAGEADQVLLPGGEREVHAGRGGALSGAALGEAPPLWRARERAGLLARHRAQVPGQVPQRHQEAEEARRRARLHRWPLDHVSSPVSRRS